MGRINDTGTMIRDSHERFALIHDLDLQRHSIIHETKLIQRDEDIRRLTIRHLLLRDDAAALQERIFEKEQEHHRLAKRHHDVVRALSEAESNRRERDRTIEEQHNDITQLKSQIQSQGNTAQESSKLLHEKLSLSKESDRLRRELEQVKSQLASYQSAVAEKLDLRRQLDTLEVELANEKRSKRRVQEKEDHSLNELRARADEAEQRLASEKKERERMAKNHDRVLSEAHGERERVEERVAGLQTKLKRAQSELDDTRSELARYRAELERAKTTTAKSKTTSTQPGLSRKRLQGQPQTEQLITLTPEVERVGVQRAMKKRGLEPSILGEKSAFSVTPFLNRSRDESSGLQADLSADDIAEKGSQGPVTADDPLEPEPGHSSDESSPEAYPPPEAEPERPLTKARGRPKKASPAMTAPKQGPGKRLGAPTKATTLQSKKRAVPNDTLENGFEIKGSQPLAVGLGDLSADVPAPAASTSIFGAFSDKEVKAKKRKILGGGRSGTILDDDDGETGQQRPHQQKPQLKGVRKRTNLGGNLTNAFASSFSPLKRDRRGVGASFLA